MRSHVRYIVCFLAFGFPLVLGYGVLPLPNFINELAAFVGFALVLALVAREPRGLALAPRAWLIAGTPIFLSAVVALQWVFLAGGRHPDAYAAATGYFLCLALAITVGWHIAHSKQSLEQWLAPIFTALLIAGLASAAACMAQYFSVGFHPALVPYLGEAGRAYGFIRQPNHQATFLGLACYAPVWMMRQRMVRPWFGIIAFLLLFFGILLTGSRTGLLITIFSLVWIARFRLAGDRSRGFVLVLVAVGCLLPAFLWWLQRDQGIAFFATAKLDQSMSEGLGMRTAIWTESARLISAHFWTGIGLMRFSQAFFLSDGAIGVGHLMSHAHNLPLQLAADFGVPIGAVVLGVLIFAFWSGRSGLRDPSIASVWGMLGCLAIHSMFEFPLWYAHFLLLGGIFLGVVANGGAWGQAVPAAGYVRWRITYLGSAALILFASVTANRDFYRVSPIYRGERNDVIAARVAEARDVFWFGKYGEFARLMLQGNITREAAGQYLNDARDLACIMVEPLHQGPIVLALAYAGKMEEAKSLVYLYWRLSKGNVDNYRSVFKSRNDPESAALLEFLDAPYPVAVPPKAIAPCLG